MTTFVSPIPVICQSARGAPLVHQAGLFFQRPIVAEVFQSRVDPADHLSKRQYARLVDEWVTAIGLRREDDGTHSLRRTKAAMIYKATGNLRAIQTLLGHRKIDNTVRYLGVDVEDALELAEHTEI